MLRSPLTMRFASVPASLLLVACTPAPPPPPAASRCDCLELPADDAPAVARVGGVAISTRQILERVREQGSTAVRRYADRAALRQLVEDQIRFELLVRAALERGLEHDPDVVEEARKVMVRKLLQHDLGPAAFGHEVSDAAIEAYYRNHEDDYRQPEKRRLAHIQLAPTEAGRAEAIKLIQKLERSPADRDLFRQLVARHSLDAQTRARGGEIMFKSRDELTEGFGPTFAGEVFGVAPGELAAAPVQSTRGWHVVKVVSRRESLMRSLDEVRDEIRERLLKGRRSKQFDKYLAEIRQRHPVALYEDRLDELLAELTGASNEVSR